MNIYRNSAVRHKNFHEVFPYTYFIQHKVTKVKYYGVRWANKLPPQDDLGVEYFSSGTLAEDFKKNPSDYYFRCHYTFDTREDAVEYEMYFVRRIFRKFDWANKNVFPPVFNGVANSLGKKWYNDGENSYFLYPNDSRTATLKLGRGENTIRKLKSHTKSVKHREKLSKAGMGRKRGKVTNPETIKRMSEANKKTNTGRKWYNDGVKNYRVGPDDKIPDGLVRGRIMSESHKANIVNNFKKNINPQ